MSQDRRYPLNVQSHKTGRLTRRHFLKLSAASVGCMLANSAWATPSSKSLQAPRRLALSSLHTGENLERIYWADGDYVAESLEEINYLLRDHRQNEVSPMNPKLLDYLHGLQQKLDQSGRIEVISGYRSPKTNAKLRATSQGVAKKSLHMRGMAIDVRLPGKDLLHARKAAIAMRAGGVGYYPNSNFLHLDVGRVRSWG